MSTTCDCDQKTTNGGNCDSSCSKEEGYNTAIETNAGPMVRSPILAFTKIGKVVQSTYEHFAHFGDGGVAPPA